MADGGSSRRGDVLGAERIAVTGVGMVCALGSTADRAFDAVLKGLRGIGEITLFDASDQRCRLAGQVPDLRVSDVAPASEASDWSRTDALAAAAAREAVQAAGLLPADFENQGLSLGGTAGSMFETESALTSLDLSTLTRERAERLLLYPLSTTVERLARAIAPFGCASTICSACSSGAIALVQGAAWLRSGRVDRVLAGGADGLCRLTFAGFNSLAATDPKPCRPFDRARAGLNLGEGAAFLVLERESTAVRRGARVLAWLTGWAVGAEAHHITHPQPSGARASALMREALGTAGLSGADVDYVSAHGTGTLHNDAMEAAALVDVFGAGVSSVLVSSQKAQLGHTLGAAGALEAVVSVLALERASVPPSVGLEEPERPELQHVRSFGMRRKLGVALSNSFGFGGMGCVLAFEHAARPAAGAPLVSRSRVVVTGAASLGPLGLRVGAANLDYGREASEPLESATIPLEPLEALVPERSRRFDRGCALLTLAVEAALAQAGLEDPNAGLIAGSAFGNVERTMRFLERIAERGGRQASPAEFPHLVASAAAGNCSIYAGLRGPVFSACDLELTAEAALHSGLDLLGLGVAERVVAGGTEASDRIVSKVRGGYREVGIELPRGEGGALFVLETADAARARAATALAEVRAAVRLRTESKLELAAPVLGERARVVLSSESALSRSLLEASSWRQVGRISVLPRTGFHEAVGAVALASAVALLIERAFDEVLVVSGGPAGASFVHLARPEAS